jgi:hypothetical protein
MIEVSLKPRRPVPRWQFWRKPRPKVIAIFAFRYDAHLVPDLLQNIEPFVDGWVSYDDRARAGPMSTDPERRHPLIEAAHGAGAQWILAVDPDERFENRLRDRMDRLTSAEGRIVWSFNLREMYSPTEFRVDGIWKKKRQKRLYPIFEDLFPIASRGSFPVDAFHGKWVPRGYSTRHSNLNLYHLKMITKERRRARSELYNKLDPERKLQAIGYDYLADEAGAEFKSIGPGREYSPPHIEDGGLWMPRPSDVENFEASKG